jgi:hypothetical protein
MGQTRSEMSVTRRGLLATGLGGLVLAPFIRERQLRAQNVLPKRMILVFTPDSNPPEWWPTGSGANFTLNEPLSDFAGLESKMLIPRRLDHSWTFDNHHIAGIVQLFTGARFDGEQNRYADGPSVDQYLLQNTELRGGTPRESIHLAVDDGRTDHRHIISYTGSGQPVAAEVNPARAFNNIFGDVTFGGMPMPTPAPLPQSQGISSAVERKIIEANSEDIKYLQRYLGYEEQQRLNMHLDSLNELRTRILNAESGGDAGNPAATCKEPDIDGHQNSLRNAETMTRWAQINADMIVSAFSCDVARVASYQFSFSGGHHEGLLGFSKSWHDEVAHISIENDTVNVGGENMTSRAAFNRFSQFWHSHVAYLAKKLDSIPEGDGTMLDNTLLYCGVESGTNHSHNPIDMQYLLVGGGNIGFNTGQFLDVGRASAHRLHVAVLNAFGADVDKFGSADDGTGPLAGIAG